MRLRETTLGLMVVVISAASGGCTLFPKASGKTTAKPAAVTPPKPKPASPAAALEPPIAELQTTAELPTPQPISEETIATLNRLPAPAKETPPPPTRQQRLAPSVRMEVTAPPSAATQPQPITAAKPRIRPAESEAEQRRLKREIDTWRREAEGNLKKLQGRQLNGEQQVIIERIHGFLDQAAAALKRNELQVASRFANTALVLSKELIQ